MRTHQDQSLHFKNNNFALSRLKGRIGQSVVETYLLESGYEVYPYGYENNYANITRFVRKDQSDITTTKIRSMPDLLVCDRDNNERFLLQIKTTSAKDESTYWIKKDDLDNYINYWAEAVLVVYFMRTGNIYCLKIADIKNPTEASLPNSSQKCFFLNLIDFYDVTTYFHLIKPHQYVKLNRDIRDILNNFGQQSC